MPDTMDVKRKIADLIESSAQFGRQGNLEKAIHTAQQAIDLTKEVYGANHIEYAESLNNLAWIYKNIDNSKAEPVFRQVLEIRKCVLGENHVEYATTLDTLARVYEAMGAYARAEPLFRQCLERTKHEVGENHWLYGLYLNRLGILYQKMGLYTSAEPLIRQSLEIRKNIRGENSVEYAESLNNLAMLYEKMGTYNKAEPLFRQSLEIMKTASDENDPGYATCLSNLGWLYKLMGAYSKAEPLLRQSLEIRRKELGENHQDYANSLNNLAMLYGITGAYEKAEPLHQQALEIRKHVLGERHPDYANSLNNLAMLYQEMGVYEKAEPLHQQALEIRMSVLGERHPDYAESLNNLAELYKSMGDYAKAEPLHKKSLEIKKAALGENHPDYAANLNNLADLYISMGDYAKAEPLHNKSLGILKTVFGENHPDYATSLNNLALLYQSMGDYAKAEPLHKKSLEIRKDVLGENHPAYAVGLNNLALFYESMGDYTKAEPLFTKSLEITKAVLGENHPDYAGGLSNLAVLYTATGQANQALLLMKEAAVVSDTLIGQVFSISSEDQKLKYLASVRPNVDSFISLVFHYFSQSPPVVRDALSLILRRKSITAEAMAAQRDAILGGKYPHLQEKLKQLNLLRMQIAQKTLTGPGREGIPEYRRLLADWTVEKECLEKDLSRQIPEMRLDYNLRNADSRVIAHSLPPKTTLVEFFRFDLFSFTAVPAKGENPWKPARYCAFVLPAGKPEAVTMIDLGEADLIDQFIANYKSRLTGEGRSFPAADRATRGQPGTAPAGSDKRLELYSALIAPLRDALGNSDRLIIAPDSQLSVIPFEVIPTPDGRYLIDQYHISYIGVGRDVLRFTMQLPGIPGKPLVLASPDFNLAAEPAQVQQERSEIPGRMSRDFTRSSLHFAPLPGTKVEGEELGSILNVQPLLEADALETRLKSVTSPLILHVATHGFFQNDTKRSLQEKTVREPGMGIKRLAGPRLENPMLRSGLALAGANTWLEDWNVHPDAEDGILTAEDVTGLDLTNTSLTVLSACETGMGDIKTGEGVFGLRRAFALAGAKTLVMSLWKVPDTPTQELMVDFYKRLLNGTPKADALREAQLEIRKKYPHPADWGAFICQGDPGPIFGAGSVQTTTVPKSGTNTDSTKSL